jgi:hypothetical protein
MKAAVLVGGEGALAEKLGVTRDVLHLWLQGDVPVPPEIFMRGTEIISGCELPGLSKPGKSDKTDEQP